MPPAIDLDAELRAVGRLFGRSAAGETSPASRQRTLLATAAAHRVELALADHLREAGVLASWPSAIQIDLAARMRHAAAVEAAQAFELRRVLARLAQSGILCVIFKGAALAYTHYRRPYLRPRHDVDLLIKRRDFPEVNARLAAAGYHRAVETSGTLVSSQAHFARVDRCGISHALDVHWKISNAHAFADRLSIEEIEERAVRLPALSDDAMVPRAVDALLLACVHRLGHHHGSHHLLWLLDIHRLVERMDAGERQELARRAAHGAVGAACRDGVAIAAAYFDTELGAALEQWLAAPFDRGRQPRYGNARRLVDVLRADFAALPGWSLRARLLSELLFPPAAFMLKKYDARSPAILPLLYLRRACAGVPGWLRRMN